MTMTRPRLEATVARESWECFRLDCVPVMQQHWKELGQPGVAFQLDEARYARADQDDRLVIVTSRLDGRLCGYIGFVIAEHPHTLQRQAVLEAVYILPSLRRQGLGIQLIREADRLLREVGCQRVYQAVHMQHPALGIVLKQLGYLSQEIIYTKRLDREG